MMRRTLRVREGMTMSCPYRRSWIAIAVAVCLAVGASWAQAPTVEPPVEPPLVADAEPDGAVGRSYWPLVFDGTNDYISATDASTADEFDVGTGAFTAAARVYVSDTTISTQNVWSKRPLANTAMWALNITANGRLSFGTHDGSTFSTTASTTIRIKPNTWTYVAVVRSGTNVTFYAGGQSQTIGSVRQDNVTNTAVVGIGAQVLAAVTAPLKGRIASPRFWNSALTTAQLATEDANRNPFAVVTKTPTWGAAFLPGTGQTVTKTWGNAAFTLGSAAGSDTNDPTWGTRQFAGRQIQ